MIQNRKLEGRDVVREHVRKRDNWTCQICLKRWKEGERRFDVHHLNGQCGKKSKGYDKISDMDGLVTLCHGCHLGLESVRKKMSKDSDMKGNYPQVDKFDRRTILKVDIPRYKMIQSMRDKRMTMQTIGDYFGVTRQRIEQILKRINELGITEDYY